ncbi:MAG: hypothetical protein ACYDEX_02135 [Mobilitalea sp.]
MQNKFKRNEKQYQLVIVIFRRYLLGGMALMLLYAILHKGFSQVHLEETIQIWGDTFVISSVILLEVVGISWLNQHAYIDWVGYSMNLSRFLLSRRKGEESFVNYYDYKSLRERNMRPLWPGIVVSVILFLLGIILSALFFVI